MRDIYVYLYIILTYLSCISKPKPKRVHVPGSVVFFAAFS